MSKFDEYIHKLGEINNVIINFKESFQEALESITKLEEEIDNEKKESKHTLKEKTVSNNLNSINEEDNTACSPLIPDVKTETTNLREKQKPSVEVDASDNIYEKYNLNNKPKRASKKRSKNEVSDMSSPEVDKRQKRTASVVAQTNISKQVNVNLAQKLRREDTERKEEKSETKSRKPKDDNKENEEPIFPIKIKEEKISLQPEPMDLVSSFNIKIEEENGDKVAMPPPVAPIPRPKRGVQKTYSEESLGEDNGRRRTTRSRKQTEPLSLPPPADKSARATRASTRATTQQAETEEIMEARSKEEAPVKESRPKRTRTKKVQQESSIDSEKDSQSTQDSGIGSPADKPRPKRTRKARKAVENNNQKDESLKQTDPSETEDSRSPIMQMKVNPKPVTNTKIAYLIDDSAETTINKNHNDETKVVEEQVDESQKTLEVIKLESPEKTYNEETNIPDKVSDQLDEKCDDLVLAKCTTVLNATITLNNALDKTVVLPNGVYNHEQVTPKDICNVNNETVVIEKFNRETLVLDKPKIAMQMDATVVLDKQPESNFTNDDSLLTDDNDTPVKTPPKEVPKIQPSSAVKEKVQQFEELASRVTRKMTRALIKKNDSPQKHTPPDKVSKVVLSAETLNKMDSMIFNGKIYQTSSSAVKISSNIPTMKHLHSSSTSKLSSIGKAREAAEEFQKREKEDARKKKEALLEAKRAIQRKKREEKMAAAAAAREIAEKERHAAMEAVIKERREKQLHADLGKRERLKEAERKKQELARKVAETEERRKAEEQARLQRLAEEQRKAELVRKKQLEEAQAMKKEEAIMAKEIEKRKKEYFEKQKMKMKINGGMTPLKAINQPCPLDPVYMLDGFQYLHSDSEDDVKHPLPRWDNSKHRREQLYLQEGIQELDTLFLVGPITPDLRAIFPDNDRANIQRTSSAIWRTPPADARYPK